jgi:hypothetical protein
MANRCRGERIAQCRTLLAPESPQQTTPAPKGDPPTRRCRLCGGNIEVVDGSCPATYHAVAPADGVKPTPPSASILLASPTGRGAWMSEVCPHGPDPTNPGDSPCYQTANQRLRVRTTGARPATCSNSKHPAQYQNPLRNAYLSLPRPPQPQATPLG